MTWFIAFDRNQEKGIGERSLDLQILGICPAFCLSDRGIFYFPK